MLDPEGCSGMVFQGREIQGHRYSGRVPLCDRRFSVGLSAGRSPWRLLCVRAA
jgi:hypothetical protein